MDRTKGELSNNETSRDSDEITFSLPSRHKLWHATYLLLQLLLACLLMAAAGILHIPIHVQTWQSLALQICKWKITMRATTKTTMITLTTTMYGKMYKRCAVWQCLWAYWCCLLHSGDTNWCAALMKSERERARGRVAERAGVLIKWSQVAAACYDNMSGADKLQQQ